MASQTASAGSGRAAFRSAVLELGEELLDRVQVGRVFGQEEAAGRRRLGWRCAHGLPLWEPRLSMTTMSPGRRVGTRTCST